ncbi:MAG: hypothetical protein JWM12_2646 [Ilumatobacteraceae bacterium]|nr:hypothetical protein [Ilumatobacteraceae bacterium]
MIDQSLVQSGFDIEVLLSARYLSYALLAQVEAGQLPLELDVVDANAGLDAHITIHPPTDYRRLYAPEPTAVLPRAVDGSFATELVLGDPDGANLQLSVVTDIVDNLSGQRRDDVTIGLMLAIGLTADVDERGFESNHRLSISLVKLDPLTQLALAFAGLPLDQVTAQIKAQLDRTVAFGVADGQAVQRAVLRSHDGDAQHQPAFGVYINLALKLGAEATAFVPDRGDVAAAVNFLESGRDVAFATPASLFARLGDDFSARMAEEDPVGSGTFRHPLREVPGDPTSKEIGTLTSVTIGPEPGPNGVGTTGRLVIDIAGEYSIDLLPDPSFHLYIKLRPVIDANGLLTWDVESSVDVDLLGSLLAVLVIVIGTVLAGPGVGATLFLLLLGADLIVDAVASAAVADRLDQLADASFLDALPHRVTVATRRWDPLYVTQHQVVGALDRFDINALGLAFDGAAVLDKTPAPVTHAVIRDEERDITGAVCGLRYRVRDLAAIAAELTAIAPGTDRLPFVAVDPTTDIRGETNLVALNLDQVHDRIDTRRLIAPILCVPERIHLENHTIRQLLVLTKRERDELHDALIDEFRTRAAARISADQGVNLAQEQTERLRTELGREPTPPEVDDAVNAHISMLVDDEQVAYEAGGFPADLTEAIAEVLRLDLVPHEFATLQGDGVLAIAGKEIIRMRRGTVYYRDRPDFYFADNLLALPRYPVPYAPAI